jgi:hypothetical protein
MLLKRGHHMKINRIAMTSAVVLAGVFGMTQGPLAQTPGQAPSATITTRCVPADQLARAGTPGSVPGSTTQSGSSTTPGSSATAPPPSSASPGTTSSTSPASGSTSSTAGQNTSARNGSSDAAASCPPGTVPVTQTTQHNQPAGTTTAPDATPSTPAPPQK